MPAVGELAGTFVGMGIPEIEAKRARAKIKDGNILISALKNSAEITQAKKVFEEAGATDISSTSRSPFSRPRRLSPEVVVRPTGATYLPARRAAPQGQTT